MSSARIVARASLAALAIAASCLSCSKSSEDKGPAPRVEVLTPAASAAPAEFRGAEDFLAACAARGRVGSAVHAILPDAAIPGAGGKAGGSAGALASYIASLASDSLVKAIVVDPAFPGSAEGFRRAKAARPELICVAGDSREDELGLEASADLVVDLDRVYRAFIVPWAAKKMGAKALVALYSSAEAADPSSSRERAIMSAACSELGLRYSAIDAPAATDAVAYARAMTGSWLRDKGPELSLFCSEPSLAAPLIAGAVAGGGIIADAAASATRAAYAVALGLDLGAAKGDAKRERALLEKAAKSLGLGGRLGLWNADFAEASVEGLAEFARREAAAPSSGAAKTDGLKALIAALDASSPEAAWLGAYDVDPSTGVKSANHVLLRQDVYVLGSGFLQSGLQSVPAKYLTMTGPAP